MKKHDENFSIVFSSYSQLSYIDNRKKHITLLVDNNKVGKLEVYTDRENEDREYIIINCEVVYLDSIKQI